MQKSFKDTKQFFLRHLFRYILYRKRVKQSSYKDQETIDTDLTSYAKITVAFFRFCHILYWYYTNEAIVSKGDWR